MDLGAERTKLLKQVHDLMAEAAEDTRSNQTLKGMHEYEQVVKLYPNDFDANFLLGYFGLIQGVAAGRNYAKIDAGVKSLETAVKLRPNCAAALSDLAIGYHFRQKYALAVQAAYQAAKIEDSKGIVQNLVNTFTEAPAGLRQSSKLKPIYDETLILASKYGLGGGQSEWEWVLPEDTVRAQRPQARRRRRRRREGSAGHHGQRDRRADLGRRVHPDQPPRRQGGRLPHGPPVRRHDEAGRPGRDRRRPGHGRDQDPVRQAAPVRPPGPLRPPAGGRGLRGVRVPAARPGHEHQLEREDDPRRGRRLGRRHAPVRRHDRRDQINPGNSGGPIVDHFGNLLAIATAKTFAGNVGDNAPISSYGLGQSSGRLRTFFKKQAAKLAGLHLVPGTQDRELTNEQLATRLTPVTVVVFICRGERPAAGTPEPPPSQP